MMLVLSIVLGQLSIHIPVVDISISISWLPVYVVGFLFGPIIGLFFGAICDTVSFLIGGGVWFWMYAIQEPILGFITGFIGSFYFLSKRYNSISFFIISRIFIYGFAIISLVSVYNNLDLIKNGWFFGSKNINHHFIIAIVITCFLLLFLIIIETLNIILYQRNKRKKASNHVFKLFICVTLAVSINIMLFSFILGPLTQLEYLKYMGNYPPTGYIKYGTIYYLMPRIIKECIKTPLYIILLFAIIYSIKNQYLMLINNVKNKWEQPKKIKNIVLYKYKKCFKMREKKIIVNAKFKEYKDDVLVVEFDNNKIGYCNRKHISDFEIKDVVKYFTRFEYYKFKVIKENNDGTYILSYKYAHPNLVKYKKNIIPTVKHFSTLKKYVNSLLAKEKEWKVK